MPYFAYRFLNTKTFLMMSGDQLGEPIRIPPTSEIYLFAIGAKNKENVLLESVIISYDPMEGIELLSDDKGTSKIGLSNDRSYPANLEFVFGGKLYIKNDQSYVFGFRYKLNTQISKFKLKFEITSVIPEEEYGFPFSIYYSPKKKKIIRIVEFAPIGYEMKNTADWLRKYGLILKTQKSFKTFGEASRVGMQAILAEGAVGEGKINVYEIMEKENQHK